MPAATGGLVGPKPVPQRINTSPGLAAAVVAPAKVPFFTARLASELRVATAWLPGQRKKAADCATTLAVAATLVPAAVVTVTGTGPVPMSGACTLIWPGLMK